MISERERIAAVEKLATAKYNEIWQPTKKGEAITGMIISMDERATDHGFKVAGYLLIIRLANGEFRKMLRGGVEGRLAEAGAVVGSIVSITFNGKQASTLPRYSFFAE
jgi:hypothetical protein